MYTEVFKAANITYTMIKVEKALKRSQNNEWQIHVPIYNCRLFILILLLNYLISQ